MLSTAQLSVGLEDGGKGSCRPRTEPLRGIPSYQGDQQGASAGQHRGEVPLRRTSCTERSDHLPRTQRTFLRYLLSQRRSSSAFPGLLCCVPALAVPRSSLACSRGRAFPASHVPALSDTQQRCQSRRTAPFGGREQGQITWGPFVPMLTAAPFSASPSCTWPPSIE